MRDQHSNVTLPVPTPVHRVHFVYFGPSDKPPTAIAAAAVDQTARHLRRWYRWQMGNGKTFNLTTPVVSVHQTTHPAAWYSTHNAGGDQSGWYWANALQELSDICGGGFYQPYDDWVLYLDADPAPGQYAGGTSGGYVSGVAVLGAHDVASVSGMPESQQNQIFGSYWTLCRGIGGCGHELGHTFGLPHPVGDPNWNQALMGVGYTIYPNSILLPANLTQLNVNPFFSPTRPDFTPLTVCKFNDNQRPIPQPPPRP